MSQETEPGNKFPVDYSQNIPLYGKVLLSVHTSEVLSISTVLCLLSFAVTKKKKEKTNSFLKGGQFYTSLSQSHHKGKPRQELKHG